LQAVLLLTCVRTAHAVPGVTLFISDFKRSIVDKLAKDFFSEPSQVGLCGGGGSCHKPEQPDCHLHGTINRPVHPPVVVSCYSAICMVVTFQPVHPACAVTVIVDMYPFRSVTGSVRLSLAISTAWRCVCMAANKFPVVLLCCRRP
jgi:hypothetical protein